MNAYCVSVSTFIFTTPYETASRISSSAEPEPPWKTRSNGRALADLLADLVLDLLEDLRAELHVAGLVDAVHVAERGGQQVAALLAEAERLDRAHRVAPAVL